jgi:hypothetical protein
MLHTFHETVLLARFGSGVVDVAVTVNVSPTRCPRLATIAVR